MPLVVPGINSDDGNATQSWMQKLTGKTISNSGPSNETQFAKSELPSGHRILKPDSMMTMDHNPSRLNVHVNDEGIVEKVTHG